MAVFPTQRESSLYKYAEKSISESRRPIFIVLNRMKNHISDFSDFYFSSYGPFCTENPSKIANFEYNNVHISKTKNRKNLKIHF